MIGCVDRDVMAGFGDVMRLIIRLRVGSFLCLDVQVIYMFYIIMFS